MDYLIQLNYFTIKKAVTINDGSHGFLVSV